MFRFQHAIDPTCSLLEEIGSAYKALHHDASKLCTHTKNRGSSLDPHLQGASGEVHPRAALRAALQHTRHHDRAGACTVSDNC